MARIAGVDIPREKRVEIGLTYIFGIGRTSSNKILDATGIDPDTRVKDLTDDQIAKLREVIENDYMVEGDLRRNIAYDIKRMKDIETMAEDGTFEVLPKKEVLQLKKELEKLQKNLGGIRDMKKLPDAIFIVDPKKERICVQEAHTLNIPLIGICDTNCDPEELTYIIPGNDDAIRAVKLIVSKMADAVIEANQGLMDVPAEGYTAYPDEESEAAAE